LKYDVFLHIAPQLFSSLLEMNFINNVLHFHVSSDNPHLFAEFRRPLGEKAVPSLEAIKEYTFPASLQ
jgi:hypothetical protein